MGLLRDRIISDQLGTEDAWPLELRPKCLIMEIKISNLLRAKEIISIYLFSFSSYYEFLYTVFLALILVGHFQIFVIYVVHGYQLLLNTELAHLSLWKCLNSLYKIYKMSWTYVPIQSCVSSFVSTSFISLINIVKFCRPWNLNPRRSHLTKTYWTL